MLDLLLRKYQLMDLLVRLFVITGLGFGGFFWFIKEWAQYRALRLAVSIEIQLFNRNCFAGDKAFFEKYKDLDRLHGYHLLEMYEDAHFREQLLKKEVNYYKEITEIVKKLRILRTYKRAGVVIGILSVPVFLLVFRIFLAFIF